MSNIEIDDEDLTANATCCVPLNPGAVRKPVDVNMLRHGSSAFWAYPLGPLLFQNETSDARDHCANERTFLSYLRLSVYMAVVSVAIVLSFHLKNEPSDFELRMAKPLGIVFWILAVSCLFLGVGNYIKTVEKYSRKAAIVQTGWKTQMLLSIIALCIVGTCVVLLVVTKLSTDSESK
ncbi:hypothetical protein F5X68DRAFT_265298 [Plectosphaerella plurivora]|uniref:DUF202 domain-containing protein n=1 Tax=Plectosphaerella plurivora TaxID=936078 RepID=A0A9P8V2F1_9PEZI|nr:hypothetical protein F5X68DRAFT_265298 [Plectosphaerella plurivora]